MKSRSEVGMAYLMLRALRRLGTVPTALVGVMGHREFLRRWCAKHYPIDILIDDFDGSLRFWCDLGEHIGSQIFWRGGYSVDQLSFLSSFLRPNMTFMDVGANQGEFTVFAANRIRSGRVIAIEPVSWIHRRLVCNVEENGFANVSCLRIGLGSEREHVEVYSQGAKFKDGTENVGLPTVFSDAKYTVPIETIELVPLDDLAVELDLDRLDALKMDIEGAELQAIEGGRETILRLRPYILVELSEENCRRAGHSAEDLLGTIEGLRYEVLSLDRSGQPTPIDRREPLASQNLVCVPKSG